MKGRRRNTSVGIDQLETLLLVTAEPFHNVMESRPRLCNARSTNLGNLLPTVMDPPSKLWMLPHQDWQLQKYL